MFTLGKRNARRMRDALHVTVCLISSASIVLGSVSASMAQTIIVDPSAPGTSFLQTSNGTPQVDIAAPQSGVSVNQFTEFNVGQNGLVLNNSTSNGVSVIGQNVTANPNLMVSGPASTIVNEITGAAPSTLAGTTEVFGQSAAVIIANPNGIGCNGCAFLNSTSSTLTTGKPIISGAQVDLLVTEGTVTIGPDGFNAGQQAGVFGRHVVINGPVATDGQLTANSLVVSGGAQRAQGLNFDQLYKTPIVAAPSTVAKTSPFAVDGSESGTLTGGRVYVRGNEAGQGVNIYGDIDGQTVNARSAGDLFYKNVTSNFGVSLLGRDVRQYGDLTATREVTIGGDSFTLYDGRKIVTGNWVDAEGNQRGKIKITADDFVVIAGEVSGAEILVDVSNGSLTNTGFLMADGDLTIVAGENFNQQRQIASEYDIYFDPALQQYLQAYYTQLMAGGPEADIAAEMIARANQHELVAEYIDRGATATGTNVTISTTNGDLKNIGGAIAATNDVRLTAGADIINSFLALRSVLGAEDGCAAEDCGYRTDFHAGEILAGHDLDLIAARDIRNEASDIAAANDVTLTSGRDVVNSLRSSNFEASELVPVQLSYSSTVWQSCGKDCTTQVVVDNTYTTNDLHFNEENVLAPARIMSLYGDVAINAEGDFVSVGSVISSGADLSISAAGQAILTSYVDDEENFVRQTHRVTEQVCSGYGKDEYCGTQNVFRATQYNSDELVTATSEFVGRSISITSGENLTILGARILASQDLDLGSTGGSVLIDSTDLPDTIALNNEGAAEFVELTDDLIGQIFGPASGEEADTVAENTAGYITFLKDSDLLTAVESLRRADSGADIKQAARDVGVQGFVSLIDSEVLAGLRADANDAIAAIHNSVGGDIDAHNAALEDYHVEVRAELAAFNAMLDDPSADRTEAMQGDLDQVAVGFDNALSDAEQNYQTALAANQAQYGHLLTQQERRSRQVSYGKDSYIEYYYVTVPNPYYVGLKNTADQNAASDHTAALNAAETQRQLSIAEVQASYTDAGLASQIADLKAQFESTLVTRAGEKAALYANMNSALSDATRKIELVVEQQALEEGLRGQAVAKGTIVEGQRSLASALTSQGFGELDRVDTISVDGTGIVENTALGQSTAQSLISPDKDEQDAFLNATAWRFSTHKGLNQLSATPRTVLLAGNDLNLGADEDIYITGETAVTAGNDLAVDAGRRIGLLGAINTNFRLNMGNGTRETGYFEEKVTVTRQPVYNFCGKDCGGVTYQDVTVTENVWVSTGFEAYDDLAYDSFSEIGETLQLGTLMRDPYLAEVPTVNSETGETDRLAYARQTGLYDLTNTSLSAAGDLSLNAGGDILNFGGSLISGENLYLTAATEIRNEALRHNFSLTPEHGCVAYGCGREGHEYKSAEILSGSGMILAAGGDIINNGAVIAAAGSILAQAEGDIVNQALTSQYLYHYINSSSLFGLKRKKELLHRAVISEGSISTEYGDVVLNAGQDVLSEGSMISAGTDVQITAERDVRLTAISEELQNYYKKRGFSGLAYGQDKITWNEFSTAFAQVEGENISISAGRDVTGIGALLFAAQDIDISAGEDITFDAHQNLRYENRSGWSLGISFGGSGIIEALLSDEDVLTAYVNTNPALAAVHRLATGDFSAGALMNLGYHLPAFGSSVNQGSADKPIGIGESLVEQLNPFSWTDDNPLFNPSGFSGTPDAQDFLTGITFRLGAYKSRQEWTESHVSQVIAGQDLWLYSGKDIVLVGGTVASANRNANLYAGESILIAALADSNRSSSSGWGLSLGFTSSGVTFGADYNRSQSSSRMYTNAALTAGEVLDVISGQDTVLMGANLAATDIYLDVGNDLVVQSRQNTSDSNSFGFSFSTSGSFSLNYADADRNYTDTPTTIVAQDRLSIYTGATTYLLGAGIWSETSNLEIDTGKLVFDNYTDSDESTSLGINGTIGNLQDLTDTSNSDLAGTFAYRNTDALTYATVGTGTIRVRDLEGYDFSGLNRDPDTMQQVISETDFSIEIPGINLTRWTQQVRETIDLIEAVTTKIPEHVRMEGAISTDLFRDMILSGLDPAAVTVIARSGQFRASVKARTKVQKLISHYGSLENVPDEDLLVMAFADASLYTAAGELEVPVDCSIWGTGCSIPAQLFASQIAVFSAEIEAGQLPDSEFIGPFATNFLNFIKACADADPDTAARVMNQLSPAFLVKLADYANTNYQSTTNSNWGVDGQLLYQALLGYNENENGLEFSLAVRNAQRVAFETHFDPALYEQLNEQAKREFDAALATLYGVVWLALEVAPVTGTAIEAYYLVQDIRSGDVYAIAAGVGMVAVSAVGGKLFAKVGEASIELGGGALEKALKKVEAPKGGAGALCFVAGTPVLTEDGYKAIEDIEVGDVVISRDEATGETVSKPVVQLFRNHDMQILDVVLDNGHQTEVLGATPEHPFFVEGRGWVEAGDLQAGDRIVSHASGEGQGGALLVKAVNARPETEDTYNFEVADTHTYFVGKTQAWVHNACFDDFNQARNAAVDAIDGAGGLNPATRAVRYTKFGPDAGKPNGFTGYTNDGRRVDFRVEYDENHGAHININIGKDKTTISWSGAADEVSNIIKQFE